MAFDWNDIPVLLALERHGTLAAAARALAVNPTTVSRRLQAAERALQVRLFLRDSGGYRPTPAGAVLLQRAAALQGDVQGMLLAAREEAQSVAGSVCLTSVEFLIAHWLVPQLPVLLERHPQLDLQLLGDNRDLSFTRHEADLALRLARPQQDAALVMRKVGELGYAVYGAERFAATRADDWRGLPWLGYADSLAQLPEARWLQRLDPQGGVRLRVTAVTSLQRACQAGLGLALLPCLVGEAAGLHRLSGVELTRELWLLCHRDLRQTLRFRAVADWLAERAAVEAARLDGTAGMAGERCG